MNAENIAKALKCCYPPEGANTCEGCPYDGIEDPTCTERNIEYHAGEIIESLLAQLDSVMASNDRFDTDNTILLKERDAAIKEKERLRVELAYADAQINWDNDKRAELEEQIGVLSKELNSVSTENIKLRDKLAESQRRERAAVEDLSTYKDCGFCVHVQDQQYCYKNCQRHVDVDNFRTHPCWQWRGPVED